MIRKNEVLKMTKIISDSCTLYTPEDALKKGLNTTPLCIIINNDNYREYVDMTSEKLLLCFFKYSCATAICITNPGIIFLLIINIL